MLLLVNHLKAHANQATKRRLSGASRNASAEVNNQRKRKKMVKAGLADTRHVKEGVVYKPGGFND